MNPKASAPVLAFTKALRSFQTGGIAYADFIAQTHVHLAAGAPAAALLEILERRETVEPLPGYVHDALVGTERLRCRSPPNPSNPNWLAFV
jgi:hypothetical protein